MSRCRSCDAELVWAVTVPKDPEKRPSRIPLDKEPVPPETKGALACVPNGDGRMFAYGMTVIGARLAAHRGIPPELAREQARAEYPWRLAHFTTCKFADQHRKAR